MDVALGFRSHLGWTAAVAVGDAGPAPAALEQRRLVQTSSRIPGSHEPYHRARELPADEARAFVRRASAAIHRASRTALGRWLEELAAQGHRVRGAGVLSARTPAPASFESAIASHARVHMAEGWLFREAIARACEAAGIPAQWIVERELFAEGGRRLPFPERELRRRLTRMGKPLGSPWAADQKLAALGAWLVLTSPRSRRSTR